MGKRRAMVMRVTVLRVYNSRGSRFWVNLRGLTTRRTGKAAASLSIHPQSSLGNHPTLTACEFKRNAKSRCTQIYRGRARSCKSSGSMSLVSFALMALRQPSYSMSLGDQDNTQMAMNSRRQLE